MEKIDGHSFHRAEDKLEHFCQTNDIGKDKIVCVSPSSMGRFCVDSKILLVWDDQC
jgi:hypothetical protein